jgi:hypothetical protein
MDNYDGPERRTVVFTRDDSDRLVRMEQQLVDASNRIQDLIRLIQNQDGRLNAQGARLDKVERAQSWLWGLGSAFVFIATIVVTWFDFHR